MTDPANLYLQALTHSSWSNENRLPDGGRAPDYERLEFLGDAVLELCVRELLLERLPAFSEGDLTAIKQRIVTNQALPQVARWLGVREWARIAPSTLNVGWDQLSSVEADIVEALLGALYLDQGIDSVREVVGCWLNQFSFEIDGPSAHPKTALQSRVNRLGGRQDDIRYRVVSMEGESHRPLFSVEVLWEGKVVGTGKGPSRQRGEIAAAQDALARLPQPRTEERKEKVHPRIALTRRLFERGIRDTEIEFRKSASPTQHEQGECEVTVLVQGKEVAVATGRSFRVAKWNAAEAALAGLESE